MADEQIIHTATGPDRELALVNLWAALLIQHQEDLAAVVARSRFGRRYTVGR